MNFNLYPYNLYILGISACLVIICLVITLMHLGVFGKTLENEQKTINNINYQLKLSKLKLQAIQEKYQEEHKNDKYYKILLPFLLTIYSAYQNDEELKGFKGYRKATRKVIKNKIKKY